MQRQDEDELMLSPEALAALADFAHARGLVVEDDTDGRTLRRVVQDSCDVIERDETFVYEYGQDGDADGDKVAVRLLGWKKVLGQQLESTGLTMWRAGEDLANYLWAHRGKYLGRGQKRVVELGCGLGLCGILAAQVNPGGLVVLTDGDELAMEKLSANVDSNTPPPPGCRMEARLLRWGEHDAFREGFPEPWDLVLAADVIYEEDAVLPLLKTVVALLSSNPSTAVFLLSFARRNVSIVKVVEVAQSLGLTSRPDESFACSSPGEHIYIMRLQQ